MNNDTRAEIAIIKALRIDYEAGGRGLTHPELLEAAHQIPMEPPRLHRLGNALLSVFGREPRPYRPDYSWDFLIVIDRLIKDAGRVDASEYSPPDAPPGKRLPLFRLNPGQFPGNQNSGRRA